MENNEQLNPDLLKVMQEAETTKEDDLKKVKGEVATQAPDFDHLVRIIEKNFKAGLYQSRAFTENEVNEEWEKFKFRNHLYKDQPPAEAERGKGAVWVKADAKPEYNVGVLVLILGEDNHITSGMWDVSNKWVLLDEYRVPECEVTHWMPLPGLPEGVETFDLPDELGQEIKKLARTELGLDESGEKEASNG